MIFVHFTHFFSSCASWNNSLPVCTSSFLEEENVNDKISYSTISVYYTSCSFKFEMIVQIGCNN